MIKFFCLSFIIVFLAQSGNVFSDSNLFDVDNIKINKKNYQTKEEILEYAFKEGFERLIKKIVLKKVYVQLPYPDRIHNRFTCMFQQQQQTLAHK